MSHALNVLNTQTHLALLTTALCRFPLSDRQQGRALTDEAHLLMTAPAWAGPDCRRRSFDPMSYYKLSILLTTS